MRLPVLFRPALWCGVLVTAAAPAVAAPPPAPDAEQVRALVRRLDDPRFAQRRDADAALRQLGIGVVPQLRQELQKRPPLEVARRIENIVNELAQLKWRADLPEALRDARRSGKPVLVFSTVGPADGLSSLATRAMQARTFPDLELVDYLNQHFVLVWHNTMLVEHPDYYQFLVRHVPHFTTAQVDGYAEGRGHQWTQTFFCTPDGRVTHQLAGFWEPQRYLAEARFAHGLMADVTGGLEERLEWDGRRAVRDRAGQCETAAENTPERKLAESFTRGAEETGQPLDVVLPEREWHMIPYG